MRTTIPLHFHVFLMQMLEWKETAILTNPLQESNGEVAPVILGSS